MNRDVHLHLEGAYAEKLIERALAEGAVFARIHRESSRRMHIDADPRSAAILTRLCRKYGYSCRESGRSGTSALLEKLRRRWTLIPGLLLGAVICMLALSRVWLVDIAFTGENASLGKRAQLLACLREQGVHAGMFRGDADADLLQKEILAHAPDHSYVGVKLQGIRLLVEAAPEAPAPRVYEIEYARDLVSRSSGVIEQVNVYSGCACVKKGDTVLRGQTLIRGEENIAKDAETGDMITAPVGALGEVIARCWYEGSAQGALTFTANVRTGRTDTSAALTLMDFSLPLLGSEGFSHEETEEEVLPIVGLFLPLEMRRTTHHETQETTIAADREMLKAHLTALAQADALRSLQAAADEYEIANFWTDVQQTDNILHVRAVYEIYTDIAAERDALIEEVY